MSIYITHRIHMDTYNTATNIRTYIHYNRIHFLSIAYICMYIRMYIYIHIYTAHTYESVCTYNMHTNCKQTSVLHVCTHFHNARHTHTCIQAKHASEVMCA